MTRSLPIVLLLGGCVTADVQRVRVGAPSITSVCTEPELVARASPAAYPSVRIEVARERSCIDHKVETYEIRRTERLSYWFTGWGLIGVGGATASLMGPLSLISLFGHETYSPAVYLSLFGVGTAVFLAGVILWRVTREVVDGQEQLPAGDHTRFVTQPVSGPLSLGGAVTQLSGGNASVDVNLAARGWSGGLSLGGDPVRADPRWTPEDAPACRHIGMWATPDDLPAGQLAAAARDSARCEALGWHAPLAPSVLEEACRKRLGTGCEGRLEPPALLLPTQLPDAGR